MNSCCNTKNSNYAVAATPETATTQLLQHQQQQLPKASYFVTAMDNRWQLSRELWRGIIKRKSKEKEHSQHEQHGEMAKEYEDPEKTVKISYPPCNS
jgi:hypothetical protein